MSDRPEQVDRPERQVKFQMFIYPSLLERAKKYAAWSGESVADLVRTALERAIPTSDPAVDAVADLIFDNILGDEETFPHPWETIQQANERGWQLIDGAGRKRLVHLQSEELRRAYKLAQTRFTMSE